MFRLQILNSQRKKKKADIHQQVSIIVTSLGWSFHATRNKNLNEYLILLEGKREYTYTSKRLLPLEQLLLPFKVRFVSIAPRLTNFRIHFIFPSSDNIENSFLFNGCRLLRYNFIPIPFTGNILELNPWLPSFTGPFILLSQEVIITNGCRISRNHFILLSQDLFIIITHGCRISRNHFILLSQKVSMIITNG